MDTSNGDMSEAFNFLKGEGGEFPLATDEYYARVLFFIADRLHKNRALASIIGNNPLLAHGNEELNSAVAAETRRTKMNPYPSNIRTKLLFETNRMNHIADEPTTTYSYVYLACTRTAKYWLLVEHDKAECSDIDHYALTELDSRTMAQFFSLFSWYADHIGLQILQQITYWIYQHDQELKDQRRRLNNAASLVSFMTEWSVLAGTVPKTSDGLEG